MFYLKKNKFFLKVTCILPLWGGGGKMKRNQIHRLFLGSLILPNSNYKNYKPELGT